MTDIDHSKSPMKQRLLPFQEDLVNKFLKNNSARIIEYSLPVGAGKTRLATEIVKRIAPDSPSILLLTLRKDLLDQYRYLFDKTMIGLEPIVVDRRRFLDFESTSGSKDSIWPSKSIILMNMNLAKRKDVLSSLTDKKWDLIIFEDSHSLSGQRYELYQQLSQSEVASRVLLMSSSPLGSGISDIERTVVNLQDVISWSGEHLQSAQRQNIKYLHYKSTPEEARLYVATKSLVDKLFRIDRTSNLLSVTLIRSALSSNYSLDGSLRRVLRELKEIRSLCAHYKEKQSDNYISAYIVRQIQEKISKEDAGLLGSITDKNYVPEHLGSLFDRLNELIDFLGEIEVDSKLDALIDYLNNAVNEKGVTHVCVWTSYAATAEYLWAALDDTFPKVYVITGATSAEERMRVVSEFENNGGILISTDASSEGVELKFVDQCINYDMPKNNMVMEVRWGRFDRFGREKPFTMLALLDDNKIFDELDVPKQSETLDYQKDN